MTSTSTAAHPQSTEAFDVVEATVGDVHLAFQSGRLTARQLVQSYLDRIEAYDRSGPNINSIITVNPDALADADRLDEALRTSGLTGPLHGIPVIIKDQADVKGLPTTLGSVLFKDFVPDHDAHVVERLRQAGAIILAKSTLGELAAGDTYGTLFGWTRNPYDVERTVGGSSGGSAASVAANLAMLAVGQEALASIRRPAAWNALVGMRPTAGLVSRTGVLGGWPTVTGTLAPVARTVHDLALLLDAMVGYDPEDPSTAAGVGHAPQSYTQALDKDGLKGARLGILRETMGRNTEPDSDDFKEVSRVFDQSVAELKAAGADIVDPIVIPELNALLAKRPGSVFGGEESFQIYMERNANPPYRTRDDVKAAPGFDTLDRRTQARWGQPFDEAAHHTYLLAREALMFNMLKVMADHRLDAIVYMGVEHSPTLISQGMNPPFIEQKGTSHLNTFLVYVPSIVVPAGFTHGRLPAGVAFIGRPYDDEKMVRLAYAYEQATHHRRPPYTTPAL